MNPSVYILLFFVSFVPYSLLAQRQLEGIVLDRDSKDRLGEVLIYNLTSKKKVFNNHRGEFRIQVDDADTLVFLKYGFFSDTLSVSGKDVLIHSMLRDYTQIEPVDVYARKSPEDVLEQAKKDYDKAYKLADPGSLLSVGPTGAGLSIGALYSLISKEARNAKRFTEYMNTVYQENVIDSKFTPDLVQSLVGLQGQQLHNFMVRFRPSYEFVMRASHYELTEYIKSKYDLFKILPDLRPLPELPRVDFNIHKEK